MAKSNGCTVTCPQRIARPLLRDKHSLDPAKQQQNNDNDENQTQPATREVTPGAAVIPRRESTHQKQNQQNNQDSSKHTFLLISKNPIVAERHSRERSRGLSWLRSGSQSLSTACGGAPL